MGRIKIGGATLNQTPFDWHHNTATIIAALEEARRQEIKILCLPELCITAYGCEDVFLSNWLAQKAMQELLVIKNFTQVFVM